MEVIVTEVWVGKTRFKVIIFNKKVTREVLENICEKGNERIIFCGDSCLNIGSGTRFDVAHGAESAIDLTIQYYQNK